MKKLVFTLGFICSINLGFAQLTFTDSLEYDGVKRAYVVYQPAIYDSTEAVPLLLNLHGRSRTALNQMRYGDFRPIADTANFIIVHPQGLRDDRNRFTWNLGNSNDTMDDAGFIDSLIDAMIARYNINESRIYATGFSRGFFMLCQYSCQLGDRIAALGGVAGSFIDSAGCGAFYPKPWMQIHGTADGITRYDDYQIDAVVKIVAEYNKCNLQPRVTRRNNSSITDGSTVTELLYTGGYRGMDVVHLRVNNGRHTWPGYGTDEPGTNYDIDASKELWHFFAQYDLTGKIGYSSAQSMHVDPIRVFPNPASGVIHIQHDSRPIYFRLKNVLGQTLLDSKSTGTHTTISVDMIPSSTYILECERGNGTQWLKVQIH